MPASYPVPSDGLVGDMLRASNRHPMRPGYLHVMVHGRKLDRPFYTFDARFALAAL